MVVSGASLVLLVGASVAVGSALSCGFHRCGWGAWGVFVGLPMFVMAVVLW